MSTWRSWILFAACFLVVVAGVGWISWTALRLESTSRRQDAREERIRLALWRMESALGPVLAEESSLPHFAYQAFYTQNDLYGSGKGSRFTFPDQTLIPSPALGSQSPYVEVHFQLNPDGTITSPQVPRSEHVELARLDPEVLGEATRRLDRARSWLARGELLARLPKPDENPAAPDPEPQTSGHELAQQQEQDSPVQTDQGIPVQTLEASQFLRNDVEARARSRVRSNIYGYNHQFADANFTIEDVAIGDMSPMWFQNELLLARRVCRGGAEYVQGAWLSWPTLREMLLNEIHDLLPQAQLLAHTANPGEELRAILASETEEPRDVLAALPVRLEPGPLKWSDSEGITPLRASLFVAWCCVAIAGGAIGLMLVGALSLSERRRDFVSAVTHELRTPLTTFRMYTEMLSEGMVKTAEKKTLYLQRLTREADRLSHLVENVLSYARLEAKKSTSPTEVTTVGEVLDGTLDRLQELASQSDLDLAIECFGDAREQRVKIDRNAVDQILFNLVDNACKYGRPVSDLPPGQAALTIQVAQQGRRICVDVCDQGAGIQPNESKRLFQPFTKSDREAAHTAPGVGLGLALCRRLARAQGGDLTLVPKSGSGACFRLSLQRA